MKKRKTTEEAEAKAEMVYWATGRTKIYPEKNFAKNYADIKARSEKTVMAYPLVSDLVQTVYGFSDQVIMYYLVSFFSSVCV